MSAFEVKVVRISGIEPIDGADAIELARIADYRSVVRKGLFKQGDLAVYIPEASVVPDWLLAVMGLEGKLAGSGKNRVKAIKLRGCLSQGLLYEMSQGEFPFIHGIDVDLAVEEGQDVAEFLGIKKYEPVIPASMAGEVCNIGNHNTLKYDIENLKKYPNTFDEENTELVYFTEKLHGTFCGIGYVPGLNHPEIFEDGDTFAFSKGLGAQGLVFKNNDKNANNVYVMAMKDVLTKLSRPLKDIFSEPVFILGEVFGKGIQDLTYGQDDKSFRVFDVYTGKPGQGRYLNYGELYSFCQKLDLAMVPVLYKGPYSRKLADDFASGKTTFNGSHTREGIVIKSYNERNDPVIGRAILKHISEDYLLRKNGTEFN